ncbi:MAG: ABC transporter permease subunit, partial [Acetobacteraceae bacterium]
LRLAGQRLGGWADRIAGLPLATPGRRRRAAGPPSRLVDVLFYTVLALALGAALWRITSYLAGSLRWSDALQALVFGLFTLARVLAVLTISCIVWVPIGVWLGLRPAYARIAQPVAQFLAAFPANLLFPPMVLVIVYFRLDPAVWLTPLMLLGTQWYVLFNVVAGAAAFPGDLREAAANFRVGGLLWWRRVMVPGILPYLVTGAITATGNAWNTSIVAELAAWGKVTLVAPGLGAYIAQATADGATSKVVLGVAVMSGFVLFFNRLVWRPLYDYARRRTSF